MKQGKMIFGAILLIALLAGMTGCGAKGTVYKNTAESYSIKIPGEFTQEEAGNADHIILNNADNTLSVIVQMFPKGDVNASTLDEFIELYHTNAIPQLVLNTEPPALSDVKVEAMTAAKAEEYVIDTEEKKAKTCITYMSSDNGFYAYTVTGETEVYDENIEALQGALSTMKEAKKKDK